MTVASTVRNFLVLEYLFTYGVGVRASLNISILDGPDRLNARLMLFHVLFVPDRFIRFLFAAGLSLGHGRLVRTALIVARELKVNLIDIYFLFIRVFNFEFS